MVATTEVTYRRRAVDDCPAKPRTGRTQITAIDVVAASVTVLRPVVIAAAVIAVATVWSPRAHADIVGDALSDVGIGHNGPVSNAIAQVGTSICPLLVQPGGQLASGATQMSGQGGLAVPIAGAVAQMAIQSQCPSFMNALANGDIPALMNGGLPVTPPGLPGLPGTPLGMAGSPLQLPGAAPATPQFAPSLGAPSLGAPSGGVPLAPAPAVAPGMPLQYASLTSPAQVPLGVPGS